MKIDSIVNTFMYAAVLLIFYCIIIKPFNFTSSLFDLHYNLIENLQFDFIMTIFKILSDLFDKEYALILKCFDFKTL
jgi:ABC-type antimicrobial peptide transport system permease subunit